MRCHICDREDETISRDPYERGGFSSCRTCQAITHELTASGDDDDYILDEEGDDYYSSS